MALQPGDFARTAQVAAHVAIAPRAGSTNAELLRQQAADPGAWPHRSILMTDDQTAGRGRRGRTWSAPPGAALAVSIVVDVAELPVAERGWVPLLAGTALTRAVAAELGDEHTVRMKWPNDVLVDGRKISGILAEVAADARTIVVGAGLNTAMTQAQLPVSTATSFAVLDHALTPDALDTLLAAYVAGLGELVHALVAVGGNAARVGIHAEVETLCATLGGPVRVHLPDGEVLLGEAVRLGAHGELVVRHEKDETSVVAGDVVHVR